MFCWRTLLWCGLHHLYLLWIRHVSFLSRHFQGSCVFSSASWSFPFLALNASHWEICLFPFFFFFLFLIPKREHIKILHSPNSISGRTTGFPFFKYQLVMNSRHWLCKVENISEVCVWRTWESPPSPLKCGQRGTISLPLIYFMFHVLKSLLVNAQDSSLGVWFKNFLITSLPMGYHKNEKCTWKYLFSDWLIPECLNLILGIFWFV